MNEMLCRECGDPINEHKLGLGCVHDIAGDEPCLCHLTPQDIAAAAVQEARRVERNRTREILEAIYDRLNNAWGDTLVRKFLVHRVRNYMNWYADTKPAEQVKS